MFEKKKITKAFAIFGFLLILGGIASLIGFREITMHFLIMTGLGVISIFPFIIVHLENLSEITKSRRVAKGAVSIITMIIVIAILLGVYGISSFNKEWRLDLTEDQIYSLSQQTYNVLNQLDEQKKYCLIVVVDTKDGFLPSMNMKQRNIANNVKQYLNNYEIYSNRVIIKYVNPYKDIPEMSLYELDQTNDLGALRISLINDEDYKKFLEQKVKDPNAAPKEPKDTTSQKLSQSMMVEEAPGPNFQYTRQMEITGFKVEEAVTKAIDLLLGSKQPQVYFLEGNGELSPNKELQFLNKIFEDSLFKIKTFRLHKVQLLSKEDDKNTEVINAIPKDCDILVIASPKVPYTPEQLNAIKAYFDNGGRGIVLADTPLQSVTKMEAVMGGISFKEDFEVTTDVNNISAILENYGVSYQSNPVMQIEPESGKPNFPRSQLRGHKITQPLIDSNYEVLFYFPGSLTKMEKLPEGINVDTLVAADAEAYQKSGDLKDSWTFTEGTDKKGPFDLGEMITKKCEGKDCKTQEMMIAVFSDSDFISDTFFRKIQTVLRPNIDLIKNTAAYMANAESKIAITPRKQQDRTIQMDKDTYNNLWVFTVIDIPLIILLFGIFLVFLRRQK